MHVCMYEYNGVRERERERERVCVYFDEGVLELDEVCVVGGLAPPPALRRICRRGAR
jgi:hypothetical protein